MSNQKSTDMWMTIFLHYLRLGLSRFAGHCKVAAVAQFSSVGNEFLVYDPDELLKTDADLPILAEFDSVQVFKTRGVIVTHGTNNFDPLSLRIFALPPRNCDALLPIKTWLEFGTNLMFTSFRMSLVARQSVRLSMEQLQHFAPMVLSHLVFEKLGIPAEERLFPVSGALDAIGRISRTIEEGHSPKGRILIPLRAEECELLFREPIPLLDSKHVGKLLALTKAEGMLVSDGNNVIGLSRKITEHYLLAHFSRGGAFIFCGDELFCHIVGGEFRSRHKDHRSVIEEITSGDARLKTAAKLAGEIAFRAAESGFGCTLVMDPREKPSEITGHKLISSATLEHFELVCGMASVDGAIQIDAKGHITSFGCLLDGQTVGEHEVRSRGARYNSALRFSARKENHEICVVVVSADGPMTVFYQGKEQYSDPWAQPVFSTEPPSEPWAGETVKNESAAAKSST